jgi:hypothetical protein
MPVKNFAVYLSTAIDKQALRLDNPHINQHKGHQMIVYSVAKFDLILLAGDIETAARRNHTAWILCGQIDKYPAAMAKVRAINAAIFTKSISVRREILRNAGMVLAK